MQCLKEAEESSSVTPHTEICVSTTQWEFLPFDTSVSRTMAKMRKWPLAPWLLKTSALLKQPLKALFFPSVSSTPRTQMQN